uniref:Uncharacterized protein n=1 Tax=Anguilla anguilla TaxID=7936 RepID=A0A0E9S7H4_ANGAN
MHTDVRLKKVEYCCSWVSEKVNKLAGMCELLAASWCHPEFVNR